MPAGIFGTRADLLVDVVLVINLLAPFIAYWGSRLARARRWQTHWRVQMSLFALMFGCLFALEGHIRFSGGSGSLVAGSPYEGTTLLKVVFLSHILPAVAVYGLWAVLVFKSFRRRNKELPGPYSKKHKRMGWVIFGGLVWIALTAIVVYALGFAATGAPAA